MLRKCTRCTVYSISEKCPRCMEKTKNPHPSRFSLEDKFGEYRRKAKEKIGK